LNFKVFLVAGNGYQWTAISLALYTLVWTKQRATVKGKLRPDLINEDVKNIILPMLTPGDHLIDIGCGEARIIERFI